MDSLPVRSNDRYPSMMTRNTALKQDDLLVRRGLKVKADDTLMHLMECNSGNCCTHRNSLTSVPNLTNENSIAVNGTSGRSQALETDTVTNKTINEEHLVLQVPSSDISMAKPGSRGDPPQIVEQKDMTKSQEWLKTYWIESCDGKTVEETDQLVLNALGGKTFWTTVDCMGILFDMLIDTGSDSTIMSKETFDRLPKDKRPKLTPTDMRIRVANKGQLKIYGRCLVRLQIGTATLECTATIADIHAQAILGMDVMTAKNCTVNCGAYTMTINGHEVALRSKRQVRRLPITTSADTVVPPLSQAIITCKINSREVDRNILVEPIIGEEEPMVRVGRSLNSPSDGVVAILVLNPADTPVILTKGERVAMAEPVLSIDAIDSETELMSLTQLEEHNSKARDNEFEKGGTAFYKMPPSTGDKMHGNFSELIAPEISSKREIEALTENLPLIPEQVKRVKSLLGRYEHLFSGELKPLGQTDLVEHGIETGSTGPIRQSPRRIHPKRAKQCSETIKDLEKRGFIEESNSPWSSPVVLVKKKDGTIRFCVDYRQLNACTKKDAHPLPKIDESFDSMAGSHYFCSLDLASGYYQVPMKEEDKAKTAFCARDGLYQFKVMPFGLCNAPATFERLMESVLRGLLWERCLVYIDDIICFGKTFKDTLGSLEMIFQRIEKAGLTLKAKKCNLFKRELKYLGFIISGQGVKCDPDKLETLNNWAKPRSVNDIRAFMGFVNYHRRFLQNLAHLSAPLVELTRKNVPFQWEKAQEDAFQTIKSMMTESGVLAHPVTEGEFILDTDASAFGIGGALSQLQKGIEVPIAFASQTLSGTERNYCTTKRELLAVVRMIEKFKHYLWGVKFTIRTDHASLLWLINFRDPQGMIARWIVRLAEYNYEIKFRPGAQHGNADGLSRSMNSCIKCSREECPGSVVANLTQVYEQYEENKMGENGMGWSNVANIWSPDGGKALPTRCDNNLFAEGYIPKLDPESLKLDQGEVQAIHLIDEELEKVNLLENHTLADIRDAQENDKCIGKVMGFLTSSNIPPKKNEYSREDPEIKVLLTRWKQLVLKEGILYRKMVHPWKEQPVLQVVLPRSLRLIILRQLHDLRISGHQGVARTMHKVQQRYYWPGYAQDVARWCAKCTACARHKGQAKPARVPMMQKPVGAPFERIALDIMDTLCTSSSGHRYILVVSDYFTKWTEAFPMKTHTAEKIADLLVERIMVYHGVPLEIHSDQGREFESNLFKCLMNLLKTDKIRTSSYHPQSDGMVERFNKTIVEMLTAFAAEKPRTWDEHLPYLMMAYRSSVHASTGVTPFAMLYGREMVLPVDLMVPKPTENTDQVVCGPEYVEWLKATLISAHNFARLNLGKSAVTQKRNYDLKTRIRPRFEQKDLIRYLYAPAANTHALGSKFVNKWLGPFMIIEEMDPVHYKIAELGSYRKKVVHINYLKKYEGSWEDAWTMTESSRLPGGTLPFGMEKTLPGESTDIDLIPDYDMMTDDEDEIIAEEVIPQRDIQEVTPPDPVIAIEPEVIPQEKDDDNIDSRALGRTRAQTRQGLTMSVTNEPWRSMKDNESKKVEVDDGLTVEDEIIPWRKLKLPFSTEVKVNNGSTIEDVIIPWRKLKPVKTSVTSIG